MKFLTFALIQVFCIGFILDNGYSNRCFSKAEQGNFNSVDKETRKEGDVD